MTEIRTKDTFKLIHQTGYEINDLKNGLIIFILLNLNTVLKHSVSRLNLQVEMRFKNDKNNKFKQNEEKITIGVVNIF